MQLVALTPKVEVPPTPLVALLVVPQPATSSELNKMLGRFLIMTPPMFFGALGDDVYEFLISDEDTLYNLGLV